MPRSQNPLAVKGYPAAAALTKKKAVKFVGDGTQSVTPITAANDKVAGISLFSISASEITKGKKASIVTKGRVVMNAAVAIVEGAAVYIDATGNATNVATSATFIGLCDEPASGANTEVSVDLRLGL